MGYKICQSSTGSLHFFSSTSFKLCKGCPREMTIHTLGPSRVFALSGPASSVPAISLWRHLAPIKRATSH